MEVAVIGVGAFGQHHARIVHDQDDRHLAAVVDVDAERGKEIAALYDTSYFPDLSDIIDEIDAAIVATPTATHYAIGCQLLEKRIHTFIEKPIALNVDEGRELISIAEKAGVILQVGHVERFNPAFVAVRDSIKKPLYIEARRTSPFPERIRDADVVLDMMIHDIDIVLDIVDAPVRDVKAVGMKVLTDKVDMAQARLEFESGVVANISSSRVSGNGFRKLRVFERNRYYSIDFLNRSSYYSELEVRNGRREVKVTAPVSFYSEPLQLELHNFFSAIADGESSGVSGSAGCRALEVALLISEKMSL